MYSRIITLLLLFCIHIHSYGQTPQVLHRFLQGKNLKGASVGFIARDIDTGDILYSYDTARELIPASVLKLVSTPVALDVLGKDFRFETHIEYDGVIADGILKGNLYIKGGGDPSLGSSHIVPEGTKNMQTEQHRFLSNWVKAIRATGIRRIEGAVIADDTLFDTEGTSMKWLREDIGSYYGAGSYGISVFDNIYRLYITTKQAGSTPEIIETDPEIPGIWFHNYLETANITTDSSYIIGAPLSPERFLYGIVPAGKESFRLRGEIPDPSLFLAQYLNLHLMNEGVHITGTPTCARLLKESGNWQPTIRKNITITYSPPLTEIIDIINKKSHNLYTDAVLKTLGLQYATKPGQILSSFGKGSAYINDYWKKKGLDTNSLWMYDGSGLAPTNKVTAEMIGEILVRMYHSPVGENFYNSLPAVGLEGSVRNFLKPLQGKARLKSGSMSRVRGYAGYIDKEEKRYAIVFIVNNYNGTASSMTKEMEKVLQSLFE